MIEQTLAIIKPDAIAAHNIGNIIDLIEKNGFEIIRLQQVALSNQAGSQFYAIHKERPFFGELVAMMTSAPVILMVLKRENAVKAWRDLMGETDPKKAAAGTIRKLFGTDIGKNATHGSDSLENAKIEIKQFFPELA